MENRVVGFLVIGIAGIVGIITLLFNRALASIVNTTCSHGPSCPMWYSIKLQTSISLVLMGVILLIGLYLVFSEQLDKMFFKPEASAKKITRTSFNKVLRTLSTDEKKVFGKLIDAHGSIFQSELVEKTGFSKVKITRVLDKLEGRDLIERKRRGMSNTVVLRH